MEARHGRHGSRDVARYYDGDKEGPGCIGGATDNSVVRRQSQKFRPKGVYRTIFFDGPYQYQRPHDVFPHKIRLH